ncbi:TonB-dependent hemoglobin/transferrin/lactoferrin family receptor [Sphingomonas cavernae]|uniref:TonB-dependent hemoglobin/transferrin/lactoferrin family receptor n=1 Tax=Sphingomonas cavernae TaxID=2320861 RepID=A0A418WMY2_9SPHN|nr:TonB-dependent hemoglobin/transferrin/lactoferrin family receptor [Sphingomonas cavernae]RJF91356.1 TonB-dependent hemoglobin/transferrin/lactoferrin family receptor [Sphingomonas cavernae]
MDRYRLTAIIACALAAPAWANAPDAADADAAGATRGRDITVIATRTPEEVKDVPATVTVKDEEDIADEMISDIKDLVRFEPGVSVRQQPSRFGAALGVTGRDGASSFNIRGLEGNRVLVQVDGVRVPDGFTFGAQAAGRGDYVDLGLVKSVEILRGAASALYGSDGLAGAVSFVTSDPADLLDEGKDYAGRVRAAYDSADEEFSETAILAGRSGSWSALVAYTRRDGHELDNKGTNDAPNSTRTTPNPQDTQSDSLLGKLVYQTGPNSRIRLTGEYQKGTVDTNVLSGITPTPPSGVLPATAVLGLQAHDSTERTRAALDWRYDGEGAIDFAQVTAYWQDGENRQFTAEDRNTALDRTRLNTFENRVYGAAADFRSDFATGSLGHHVAWGGDISITRQEGLRGGTIPPAGETYPTRAFPVTDFTRGGIYVSDTIEIAGGAFTLYPALRFDYYDLSPKDDPLLPTFAAAKQDGSRLSPKIGAVAKIGGGVSVFANYAQGFKAPEPSQVNQFFENPAFGYRSEPNPDLKPETSKTIEGGLRFSTDHLFAGITGFSGKYRNFISQEVVSGAGTVANPLVYQFVNLARARIEGVEGKLEAHTDWGLTGQFAISYAKGDINDDTEHMPLSSVDPLKLVMGIGWRDPGDRFGGQLIMTHSERKELGRTTYTAANGAPASICTAPCFRPDAFTILDATAFVRIADAFTLRAGVFNILEKKYALWSDVRGLAATSTITDAFTQPGRNVSLSLTARF